MSDRNRPHQSSPFAGARSARHASMPAALRSLRHENDQLRRQLARMHAIIDAIAEGVAVSGKDGCLEVFNAAAAEIMGVGLVTSSQEEWSSLYGLYLPDQTTPCPTDQLPLVRAAAGEHVEGMELVVRHPNHENPVHLNVSASPFFDDQGKIDGGVAIFQDVTERLQAARLLTEAHRQLELRIGELKSSEQKYQDLYENAPDMYVTVESKHGSIIECNRTLAQVTGFSKSEIVGKSFSFLHDPACLSELATALESFQQTGRFENQEFVLRCKDGSLIDVSANMSAVRDDDGRVIRGRCVWREITQWKRAEESLARHREELAHLTRVHTAGEIATGLAHELSQPLSAIVNYTRGFSRRAKVGAVVTEELQIAADATVSEAERAAEIIAGLRRLVAKQSPAQTRIDINQVVEDAVLMCRGEARRQGVSIELELNREPLRSVVDAVQIKQVVICLVLNSIEAMTDGQTGSPRILLTTQRCDHTHVSIEVNDNGAGVCPTLSEKVFEAFYTTKPYGMGMGLAICRSIVENHGGRISNRRSRIGGSVFSVVLPVNTTITESGAAL